jgi:hypothetical protein
MTTLQTIADQLGEIQDEQSLHTIGADFLREILPLLLRPAVRVAQSEDGLPVRLTLEIDVEQSAAADLHRLCIRYGLVGTPSGLVALCEKHPKPAHIRLWTLLKEHYPNLEDPCNCKGRGTSLHDLTCPQRIRSHVAAVVEGNLPETQEMSVREMNVFGRWLQELTSGELRTIKSVDGETVEAIVIPAHGSRERLSEALESYHPPSWGAITPDQIPKQGS